ncbi:mannitol dehydrogenase family protein [Microterricola viridarii]|uniref:mannitol dehydrogenase family protein n=1 Tax=Microterricola viridarii TaxID=412690 RepID=UPI000AD191B1|nr:mannitol dehydrogenase family protein [Microterricola viridarii]
MSIATDIDTAVAPLSRAALAARTGENVRTPPVRIIHLGLGAFHRAHQAWYTDQVDDNGEWGIAAFTGRSAQAALELSPQDGLYTLIERSDAGDSAALVSSIVEAVDGSDTARFVELMAAESTALVTLTVTEAGYRLRADGSPDLGDSALAADVAFLADNLDRAARGAFSAGGPTTTLGRLVLGLEARRLAGAGAIAIVPCDNMPDNGPLVERAVWALAAMLNTETAEWIAAHVAFVSTSVDRITPKTTADDIEAAAGLTGWADRAPVVTEPFRDWVLSGHFPAGRPAWERAGARFVDDIEPFERRKLWLLNGAHSLLAYAGLLRGLDSVAAAMTDPVCRGWVNEFWDDAVRHLPAELLALDEYRAALLERFDNTRIEHRLAQISAEAVTKLRVRIAPVVLAERAEGRQAAAGIRAIASWASLVLAGRPMVDAEAAQIAVIASRPTDAAIAGLVALVDARLAQDAAILADITALIGEHQAE